MPGGVVETFTLSDTIIGLHAEPNGTVYALAQQDNSTGVRINRLYRLDGAESAAPSLTLLSDTLSTFTTGVSITGDGTDLYYISNGTTGNGRVFRIETNTFTDTLVGAQTQLPSVGGFAYDRSTGRTYLLDNSTFGGSNSLYFTDNLAPGAGVQIPLTLVGALDDTIVSSGLHFFGGQLYAGVRNTDTGNFEVGTLDLTTGAYTPISVLLGGITGSTPTGLAVIPAPGGAAVLGLGLIAASRRRRR
jgi:MYXO-CTERM domain-containing protein